VSDDLLHGDVLLNEPFDASCCTYAKGRGGSVGGGGFSTAVASMVTTWCSKGGMRVIYVRLMAHFSVTCAAGAAI
jgi:hypothetical protein